MRLLFIACIILPFSIFGQNPNLTPKLDSVNQKYGYVNSQNEYVISPTFNYGNDFISPYTSVKIDTLWGVIDTTGKYIVKPIYNQISAVYRGCFLEYGKENFKFRSIDGSIKYEYLFIPGPFKQISDSINSLGLEKLPDGELILRVLEMSKTFCHYYTRFRIYNMTALTSTLAAKWTIDYVLNNSSEVIKWINADKKFEAAFKNGEIDCCGHGPVWYGK